MLPIGGLKEKLLASKRSGLKTVLVPKANEIDLSEISDEIKSGLKIIFVDEVEDVLPHVLVDGKKKSRKKPAKNAAPKKSKPKQKQAAANSKAAKQKPSRTSRPESRI